MHCLYPSAHRACGLHPAPHHGSVCLPCPAGSEAVRATSAFFQPRSASATGQRMSCRAIEATSRFVRKPLSKGLLPNMFLARAGEQGAGGFTIVRKLVACPKPKHVLSCTHSKQAGTTLPQARAGCTLQPTIFDKAYRSCILPRQGHISVNQACGTPWICHSEGKLEGTLVVSRESQVLQGHGLCHGRSCAYPQRRPTVQGCTLGLEVRTHWGSTKR